MTTLIGFGNPNFGVGQATQRLRNLLEACVEDFQFQAVFKMRGTRKSASSEVITALNADLVALEMATWPRKLLTDTYHIGFWSWELEDFPKALEPARELVNEIWTVSNFAANGIKGNADKLVRRIVLPVPASAKSRQMNSGVFTFITSFDYNSDSQRKNPGASIGAYLNAFSEGDGTKLIVKSINGDRHKRDAEALRAKAEGREDVLFIDESLSRENYQNLMESVDCFVSLHRAEGYGLNLADAMGLGLPVIATGYSGNLEFMNESNSMLVPYSLEKIDTYAGFSVQSRWAEPDLGAASEAMIRIRNDNQFYESISSNARKHITTEFNLQVAAEKFRREFCE